MNYTYLDEKYNPLVTYTSVSPSSAISFTSGTYKEICRLTLTKGWWLLVGVMSWPNAASGYREIGFNTSASNAGRWCTALPASSAVWMRMQNVRLFYVEADSQDWIFYGYQNSGSTISSQYGTMQALKLRG